MKKYLLLFFIIALSTNTLAIFFDDFIPSIDKMRDFYNNYSPNMLPQFDREKRLESQVADGVMDGEAIHIGEKENFFSIFTAADESKNVGVVLLHTRGENPNEERLIKPLRVDMAENGYHTLSVQMPVLDKNAKYYDYVPIFSHAHPRIKAAIDFFKAMQVEKIIFVAHGCGGHMLMSYIDKFDDNRIDAVIGIGMGATDTGQEIVKQYPLATMQSPVLDVIGSRDYPSVKKHFVSRAPHLKLGNKLSAQVVLKNSHHYHNEVGEFDILLATIYNFLDNVI